jgi:hypothetical protein
MGYYDGINTYGNDDYFGKNNLINELPVKFRKYLLSKNIVSNRLKNQFNVIELSIEKWEKIYNLVEIFSSDFNLTSNIPFINFYIGFNTCALCISFASYYKENVGIPKANTDKCSVCPLSKIDQCTRKNSTFKKIEIKLDYFKYKELTEPFKSVEDHLIELKSLISKMIKNLQLVKETSA